MNGLVHTVTCVRDPDPDTECPPVSSADATALKLGEEAAEDARLETLERESSAPPPYLYRGRRERCFFPTRKTRWRKG